MRLRAWISSWAGTLRIMIFERKLRRELTRPLDGTDYGDVPPPEE